MQLIIAPIVTNEEFASNLALDFSAIVRSKGGISYVPWAEVVRALHQRVPGATYGFKETSEGSIIHYTANNNAYFRPYLTRYFPEKDLIIETPPGFFPATNASARHRAVADPDVRLLDNCVRRAIAKEIGLMTGIGLQLWAESDPLDEGEEEIPVSSSTSKPAASSNGSKAPIARGPAPVESAPSATPGSLDKAAEAAGLTEHGKKTIAIAVRADNWNDIEAEKAPKIIQLLADPDKVKLFNAGKNSQGKTINPKTSEEETKELVEAFNASLSKATEESAAS